jgi:hypothetical protein
LGSLIGLWIAAYPVNWCVRGRALMPRATIGQCQRVVVGCWWFVLCLFLCFGVSAIISVCVCGLLVRLGPRLRCGLQVAQPRSPRWTGATLRPVGYTSLRSLVAPVSCIEHRTQSLEPRGRSQKTEDRRPTIESTKRELLLLLLPLRLLRVAHVAHVARMP